MGHKQKMPIIHFFILPDKSSKTNHLICRNCLNYYRAIFVILVLQQQMIGQGRKLMIDQRLQRVEADFANKSLNNEEIEYLISTNTTSTQILRLKSNNISARGAYLLSLGNWSNLKHIGLWGNPIGIKGCKQLSRAKFPNLTYLGLGQGNIEAAGVHHLTKADWQNITQISLSINRLGTNSMYYFVRGTWKQLKIVFLDTNRLDFSELDNIVISEFPNLFHFILNKNPVLIENYFQLSMKLSARWTEQVDVAF